MIDTTFEIEYRHGIDVSEPEKPLSRVQKHVLLATAFVLFIVECYLFYKFQAPAFICIIPELIVYYLVYSVITYQYTPPPSLLLEPRFMVCANQVLYYSLIERVVILDGKVQLYVGNKLAFTLDRTRFKSVSTKPAKVKINQQKRFDAVVKELLPRIENYNPEVKIER